MKAHTHAPQTPNAVKKAPPQRILLSGHGGHAFMAGLDPAGPGPSFGGLGIQPKLEFNPTGDKFEQEADRVAGMVMRLPDPEQSFQAGYEENLPLTKP